MKKIKAIFLFLAVFLAIGLAAPQARALDTTDQSVTSGCHSVDAVVSLSDSGQLTQTAKAVIVYELNSDTMIYTWNPDGKIYPSSMVKLMTALVAIENGNLDDKVVVTKRALSYVQIGSVSAELVAGEELTLEDLLYCMMAASANDAAVVIAEHIGGTQDGFVDMMNQRAQELGCTGTHYSNAHGLHDEETYTTARDVCRLLDTALENETFRTLFSAKTYTVPATNKSEERAIHTSNYMMSNAVDKRYLDDRVTGGKTGATTEAGRCLAATAEGGGMDVLTIVMGAEATYEEGGLSLKTFGSFEETTTLLDYVFENFEYRQIFSDGQTISQFSVENGANSVVTRPEKTASTVLPVDLDESKLTWIYGDTTAAVTAPVAEGQKLSTIQVWYGSKCLAQSDLVAANAVAVYQAPVTPEVPDTEDDSGSWTLLLWICLGIAGVVLLINLVNLARKGIRKARLNARRRRRRENRRRSR